MSRVEINWSLGLMAKYWQPGQVKTRLGRSIGMQKAAMLHRHFVSHLCRTLAELPGEKNLVFAPDDAEERVAAAMRSWGVSDNWNLNPQGSGDLGQRMQRWFQSRLDSRHGDDIGASDSIEDWDGQHRADSHSDRGNPKAIMIGADCPTIDPPLIRHVVDQLDRFDMVLGPAVDGGYFLIGLCGDWDAPPSRFSPLFRDIPWGTDQVLELTLRRAADAGLTTDCLQPQIDIDDLDDLNQLLTSLPHDAEHVQNLLAPIKRILDDPDDSDPSHPTPCESTK